MAAWIGVGRDTRTGRGSGREEECSRGSCSSSDEEMEYSGANSIFLRIFFDKKYALPYRVVDACVFHFLKFRNEKRELPVLWHQAFLTFVQRYKGHISSEQKEALLELLKFQQHEKITPEIRRELQHAKCRDEEMDEPMMDPM